MLEWLLIRPKRHGYPLKAKGTLYVIWRRCNGNGYPPEAIYTLSKWLLMILV